jgi:hypothetical protein
MVNASVVMLAAISVAAGALGFLRNRNRSHAASAHQPRQSLIGGGRRLACCNGSSASGSLPYCATRRFELHIHDDKRASIDNPS